MGIDVRRADERYLTETEGRTTRHSFAFGSHYDPANLSFAAMIALNDETLPPGTGYPDHRHTDTEIVTWVLSGALRHTDASGNTGILGPGQVQRISAGDGIVHAETTEPGVRTRFLQTWLRPDVPGGPASYAVAPGTAGSDLTEVVGPGSLTVAVDGARLLLVEGAHEPLRLPEAPRLHVFVAAGRVNLGERALGPGDAARLTDQGGRTLEVTEAATLAVWAFDA